MRVLLLAGISQLALSAATASAQTSTFDYTGAVQTYTAPITGEYNIVATGAAGGVEHWTFHPDSNGGAGAQIGGTFPLISGEELSIVVGGHGSNGPEHAYGGAGGGGGTFVVGPGSTPLLIAGGGGGGGGGVHQDGGNAQNSPAAPSGNGYQSGEGGIGDAGGSGGGGTYQNPYAVAVGGAGGGGFKGSGAKGNNGGTYTPAGGASFAAGSAGGAGGIGRYGNGGSGGFGGGGGGGGGYYVLGGKAGSGGGGGGGYSGGGGGGYVNRTNVGSYNGGGAGGGAGGSFNASSTYLPFKTVILSGGDGEVTITEPPSLALPSPVPEPATLMLFGIGFAGLLSSRRRRRRL